MARGWSWGNQLWTPSSGRPGDIRVNRDDLIYPSARNYVVTATPQPIYLETHVAPHDPNPTPISETDFKRMEYSRDEAIGSNTPIPTWRSVKCELYPECLDSAIEERFWGWACGRCENVPDTTKILKAPPPSDDRIPARYTWKSQRGRK